MKALTILLVVAQMNSTSEYKGEATTTKTAEYNGEQTTTTTAEVKEAWRPGHANPAVVEASQKRKKLKPGTWIYEAGNGKWRTFYKNKKEGQIIQLKNQKGEWVDTKASDWKYD